MRTTEAALSVFKILVSIPLRIRLAAVSSVGITSSLFLAQANCAVEPGEMLTREKRRIQRGS